MQLSPLMSGRVLQPTAAAVWTYLVGHSWYVDVSWYVRLHPVSVFSYRYQLLYSIPTETMSHLG